MEHDKIGRRPVNRGRWVPARIFNLLIAAVVTLGLGVVVYVYVAARPAKAVSSELSLNELIRLHVVANSDTPADQALKYKVRDAILARFTDEFAGLSSAKDAERAIEAGLVDIADLAAAVVRAAGKQYPVTAEFGTFPFPVKTYGAFVLPAGQYKALRVVIGEGQGKNWWCILFPPVCFLNIDSAVAQSRVRVLGSDGTSGAISGRPALGAKPGAGTVGTRVVLSFRLGGTDLASQGAHSTQFSRGVVKAGGAGLSGGWWPVALWSVLRLIQVGR